MNEQRNVELVKQLYDAFGRGEVPFILEHLTDDVKWYSHFESIVPWAGDFSGKKTVKGFFDAIFQSVDVTAFAPAEFIAQDDAVVSLGEFGCRVRATGKTARTRWVFIWKFRDGRICGYEQFHDPALAQAFRQS